MQELTISYNTAK